MTAGRIRGILSCAWRMLTGPRGGAVAFLALKVLDDLVFLALLANMCDSRFRFLPELPDRLVVILYEAAVVLWIALFVLGVFLLLVPIIPLFCRKLGVAYVMFVHNLGAVFVGALLFFPEFMLGLITCDLYDVCRENVMCADPGKRKPQPRLHQKGWSFCDRRYDLSPRGNDLRCYRLCDYRVRYLPDEHRWMDRVLLEDIVQWEEKKDRLYLLTLKDEKYVLNFGSGVVHKYPDSDAYRRSEEIDEIFTRLEGRAHFLNKYE